VYVFPDTDNQEIYTVGSLSKGRINDLPASMYGGIPIGDATLKDFPSLPKGFFYEENDGEVAVGWGNSGVEVLLADGFKYLHELEGFLLSIKKEDE